MECDISINISISVLHAHLAWAMECDISNNISISVLHAHLAWAMECDISNNISISVLHAHIAWAKEGFNKPYRPPFSPLPTLTLTQTPILPLPN